MTAPRGGPGGPQPSGGGGVPSAVRGAVLVGLAVIAGIVGLQIIDDSGPGSGTTSAVINTIAPSGTTVTTVASTGAPATTVAGNNTPATTVPKLKSPSNVKVKVFNASGVPGVAQAMTDRLKAAGYNTLAPANLDKTRTGSVVTCRTGFENEGKIIAIYQVKNNATYEQFPNSPPAGSGDADCLVILGKAA